MNVNDLKFIENLHKWPLSSVDLVKHKDQLLIRKTVHKDFKVEVDKQEFLSNYCIHVNIPKILAVEEFTNKCVFVMEYIRNDHRPSEFETVQVANIFHKDTKKLGSSLFVRCDFDMFKEALADVEEYLQTQVVGANYLQTLFSTQFSVVHGDWRSEQLLVSKGNYYIIDFGKSFIGPSVLDFGFQFLKNPNYTLNIPYSRAEVQKARIAAAVLTIKWFLICKEKYIDYDYKKEIMDLLLVISQCCDLK